MTKKRKKEKYIEEIKGVIQEHLIHADWLDVDQSPTACASCPPRLLLILYNAANLTMIECLSRQLYCTVAQNAYVTNLLLDCACIYTEDRVICQRAPICRFVLFFFSLSVQRSRISREAFADTRRILSLSAATRTGNPAFG